MDRLFFVGKCGKYGKIGSYSEWLRPDQGNNAQASIATLESNRYGISFLISIYFTGSSRLSDSALRRACYVVRFIFADRPDLRRSYYRMFGRFALMATTEVSCTTLNYYIEILVNKRQVFIEC